MDYFQKEKLIHKILNSNIFIDEPVGLTISLPNAQVKAQSVYVYEKYYEQAINDGLMTNDDLLYHLAIIDEWNPQILSEIEKIKYDIEKITKGLLSLLFNTTKLEKARLMIRIAEKELIKKITIKNRVLENSAETYATLKQQQFIITKIANTNNAFVWPSFDIFLDSVDQNLMSKLLEIVFISSKVPQNIIRLLARTNPWRQIWLSSKGMGSIFGTSPCDWSENQINLIFWSRNYDLVHEAYERPSTDIIDDDDLLDSWFLNQTDKIESKCKSDLSKSICGSKNKNGRQENFIISDKNGAKKIYDMNDPLSRVKIKARQQVLNAKGFVKEQNMPDSQQEIREKAMLALKDRIDHNKGFAIKR